MDGGKSSAGTGTVRIYLEGGVGDWTALISRLLVERADPADSGNYTCAPWRGKAASVSVFISQGNIITYRVYKGYLITERILEMSHIIIEYK